MTEASPSSLPPSKIPGTSNKGPFIALAALLLAAGGGFFLWKANSQPPPTIVTPPAPSGSVVARPSLTDAPPPPPPDEVPEATPSAKPRTGGLSCGGPCSGNASGGLVNEVQARANRAKGCYQRALRQNEGLKGSMSVALRIDAGGNVCNASVASDTTGSPEVARCVVGMFQGQRLGSPPSGGCVDMKVPLRFETVNR
ncbi:MAG TPA: AgmX/PglI C-terminal domain-containing protein [Polyangiaceae bacterium]|nr:AgmX/PglI C-terminal domain-containing protein [Polyangiaceae bacterium]